MCSMVSYKKSNSINSGYFQTGDIIYSGKKLQNLHCDIPIDDNPIVLYMNNVVVNIFVPKTCPHVLL